MLIRPSNDLLEDHTKFTITSGIMNLNKSKSLWGPSESMKETIKQNSAHTGTDVGSIHVNKAKNVPPDP